jgi:hypothetical protein
MNHPVEEGGIAVNFRPGRLADDAVVFIDQIKVLFTH